MSLTALARPALFAAGLLVLATPQVFAFDLDDAMGAVDMLQMMTPAQQAAPQPAAATPGKPAAPKVAAPKPAAYPGLPPQTETRYLDGEVLVETKLGLRPADLTALAQKHRLTLEQTDNNSLLGAMVYRFAYGDSRTLRQVIIELSADPRVMLSQPNYLYALTQAASGSAMPQYAADLLHLADAHAMATGTGIKIGVLDTGIAEDIPDLANSVVDRYDPIGPTPNDNLSHGTSIAGVIAAHSQLMGVAPAASIIAVRAFNSIDNGAPASTSFLLIESLDWVAAKLVRIVNMSFAGPRDPLFLTEIGKAHAKGMLIVAAAGNDGPKAAPDYPAADPNVLGVTAIDEQKHVLPQANQGVYVAMAAPGVDVLVDLPTGGYDTSSGTSVAAAHVSGIAALLLEKNSALTADQLRQLLGKTATDLGAKGIDPVFGAGLVDPEQALQTLGKTTAGAK